MKITFNEPFKIKDYKAGTEEIISSELDLEKYLKKNNKQQVQDSLEELERKEKAQKEREDKEELLDATRKVKSIKMRSNKLLTIKNKRYIGKDLRNLRGIKRQSCVEDKVREDLTKKMDL